MRRVAVEFDHDALLAPYAIALERAAADEHVRVELGHRETDATNEGDELGFQLTSRHSRTGPEALEYVSYR